MKWVKIKMFSRYEVSTTGLIRNKYRVLSPCLSKKGYPRTALIDDNGKTKSVLVHRMVANSFLDNPFSLPEINHIDGDKTNNCIDNLEWCTSRHNQLHAYRMGLKNQFKGEQHGRAKLTKFKVDEIRRLYSSGKVGQVALGKKFGVSKSNIYYIVNNKTWIQQDL